MPYCGGGEKRTLKIAAKYGDRSNFGKSVPEFVHKSTILAGHCADLGRNFDEIGRFMIEHESVYDAWTLMASIAAVTSRIRIGQMCTCVLYRQPSLLAKLAVSVDSISNGRLDVGIGAGWSFKEFAAYGYNYPSNGVRLDMLEETAKILKAMWSGDNARFEGEHYRIDEPILRPKPIQSPHPPLWICGGGEKRTLKIAAKYGDRSNFGKSVPEFVHKSTILAGHCADLGRNFDEIGRTVHIMSIVGNDRADLDKKLAVAARRRGCTADEFEQKHLVGTVDEGSSVVAEYDEAGCSELILYFYDMGEGDSQDLFASEVMPQFHS